MRIIGSTLAALSLGLVLAGCAQQEVITPVAGQSSQQFNRDKEACLQEARKYYGATNNNLTISDVYLVCLKSKGYSEIEKFYWVIISYLQRLRKS
jgi:hypothetical protein